MVQHCFKKSKVNRIYVLISFGLFQFSCASWFAEKDSNSRYHQFKHDSLIDPTPVRIITFNTGLLSLLEYRKLRINVVACVGERMQLQVNEFFTPGPNREVGGSGDRFVLMLQEVWTYEAYKSFRKRAYEMEYNVIPPS